MSLDPESPSSAGKRKVTGSKRIEFETWFARLSGWAEHILARLEEGVVAKLELGGYRVGTTRALSCNEVPILGSATIDKENNRYCEL